MLEDAPMTAQDALAALMIATSASDENIRTAELVKMSNAINNLPIFAGYDPARHPRMSKPPMHYRAMWPPPMDRSRGKRHGCWKKSAMNWNSTGCTPPRSNAVPAHGT